MEKIETKYNNNKLTILISIYNGANLIQRMFESLLKQTNHDFNVIVCNDGSTDNTLEELNKYKKQFDEINIPFLIISQPNGGVSAAVNTMLKKVETEYFVSADYDDWYDDNFVDEFYKLINKNNNVEFAITRARHWNEKGDLLNEKYFSDDDLKNIYEIYIINIVPSCSGVHITKKSSFIKYNGGNDQIFDSRRGQNLQLILPMVKNVTPYLMKNTYYNILIRQNSLSHIKQTPSQKYLSDQRFIEIYSKLLSSPEDKKYLKERIHYFANDMCNCAWADKSYEKFLKAYKMSNKTFKNFIKLIFLKFPILITLKRKIKN